MTAAWFAAGPAVGLWVVLWYAIFAFWAIGCFRHRRWVFFFVGFVLPFMWLVGDLLRDRRDRP